MPLVNGVKLGVNPCKVFSNVITQNSAAYLQSLLLTLPIIEILESFSPDLKPIFRVISGKGVGYLPLACRISALSLLE